MSSQLQTPRLRLRPLDDDDREPLHGLCGRAEVRRYLFDGHCPTRQQTDDLVKQSRTSFRERGFGFWGLRRAAGTELIGLCGLAFLPRLDGVEILYALAPEHWGSGLATEASRAVLRFGFEHAGLDRILGEVDTPNQASVNVLERLGMSLQEEVELDGQPLVHYAISRPTFLRSDAQPEM